MIAAADTGSWTPVSIVLAVAFIAFVLWGIWWVFDEPADDLELAPAAEPEWLPGVEEYFDFDLFRERA